MILARGLNYAYGSEPIFVGADFTVDNNAKVGLVGQNGSGKSTLFKLITKEEMPDDGKLIVEGNVVLVPQEVKRDEKMETAASIRQYLDPHNQKQDYELMRLLAGLELASFTLEQRPQNLSGGQRTKLAIARALVIQPDILLMDEPTNFLDIEGKRWVMNFLGRYPKTLFIVSHDLNLLDGNINKILEVNKSNGKIDEYSGNYTTYLKLKEDKEAMMMRQSETALKHLKQMKEGLVKMAHVKSQKGVRQRMNLERRVEHLENNLPEVPEAVKKIKVRVPEPTWCGEMPIIVKNVSKKYGDKVVLENVNFDIRRGERIALVGQNGAGKSTLIKIIMGVVKEDNGIVIADSKVKIGYYSQEFEAYDMNKTLMQTVKDKTQAGESVIRPLLSRFLFDRDKVFQKVGTLSGGEKTRLAIALLLSQSCNMLILDEPTTYLDVLSQRLILEALKDYRGAMLVVSHTPEFINELKPSRKFLLPENKMVLVAN
jgi:ATPase subunit of ABC transporter with duplicated ATPase domains